MDYIREAIEYLKSYKDLEMAVINLREEVQTLTAELKGSAITYTDMPGGSGEFKADDVLLNKIYRIQKAKHEYAASSKTIKRIDRILEDLNVDDESKNYGVVLRQWFIDRRDKLEISSDLGYSMSHLYRIKDQAIRKFAVQVFGISVIR